MMRKVAIVLGILVALVVLGGVIASVMIDPLVRRTVESESTAALKVPTRLDDADIRFSGGLTLQRFEIHNPPAFSEPRAITFNRLDVAVRPRELLDNPIDIDQVTVVAPELTLEFTGTKNNLSTLLDNLKADRAPGAEKTDGKKYLIRALRIEGATVRFRSDLLSGGVRSLTLPPIDLQNVGTAEGGATMGEILGVVLQALGTAALQAGEGMVPADLLRSLRGDLEGRLKELPGRALEELQKKLPELRNPLDRKTAD